MIDVWDVAGAPATVALVHGGFWKAMYDREHVRPLANALAAHGLSVASIEYPRVGMPGGGWPGTVTSTFAALRAVLADEALGGVPVVAVGHSAGGHLVALAGSEGGVDGLAGVVPLAGVVDLALADGLRLGSGAASALMGGADPEGWHRADPARLRLGVPAVLIHGSDDDIVPIRVSRSYVESRDAEDAPARLIALEGVGHFELIDPLHDTAFAALLAAIHSLAGPGATA